MVAFNLSYSFFLLFLVLTFVAKETPQLGDEDSHGEARWSYEEVQGGAYAIHLPSLMATTTLTQRCHCLHFLFEDAGECSVPLVGKVAGKHISRLLKKRCKRKSCE